MFFILIENFKFVFEFQKEVEVYKSIRLIYAVLIIMQYKLHILMCQDTMATANSL